MSVQEPKPPEDLRTNTIEARIVKQKIWRKLWVDNEHFMAAIVGREGSGKSITGIRIAEAADRTFTAQRVMFEPKRLLEQLRDWKEAGETQGKMVIADEAGVGLGVRTWYDKSQVMFNQVLQIIRDENMGIIFTLPRLNELDSQTRGRLHAVLEMTDKDPGNWAELKWFNWDPSRDERDKIYRKYPKLRVSGHQRQIKRLRFGPPSQELIDNYEQRKDQFQREFYEETIKEMEDGDGEDDGNQLQEVAEEIIEETLSEYVNVHNGNHTLYVDKQLIRADYGLSLNDAQTVKRLIEREVDLEERKEDLVS